MDKLAWKTEVWNRRAGRVESLKQGKAIVTIRSRERITIVLVEDNALCRPGSLFNSSET